MARQSKKEVIDLNPISKGNTVKIGKVSITTEKSGSSKIRFTYNSNQFSHGVGRLDNDIYRDQVYKNCKEIAIDLAMKKFDPDKWKLTYFGIDSGSKVVNFPNNNVSSQPPVKSELTLLDVWENYLSVRGDSLAYNTLKIPVTAAKRHLDYAIGIDPSCVYLDNIDKFVNILKAKYANSTLLNDFTYYNSACEIAMRQGKIKGNPIFLYLESLKSKQQKKPIESFTKEDVAMIVKTFYDNPYPILSCTDTLKNGDKKDYYYTDSKERAAHYAPLVEFRFLTGMRPSEAHSLTWSDIKLNGDSPVITIQKRLSHDGKNVDDGTKNGVFSRIFPINDRLMELINRLPNIPNENNLVFPRYGDNGRIKGNPYKSSPSHIFTTIVDGLYNDGLISGSIPYYNERHTFTTEVLKSGKVEINTLASLIGNSPQTIYNHYYATEKNITIPDIY